MKRINNTIIFLSVGIIIGGFYNAWYYSVKDNMFMLAITYGYTCLSVLNLLMALRRRRQMRSIEKEIEERFKEWIEELKNKIEND